MAYEPLTIYALEKVAPKKLKGRITQSLVDNINGTFTDQTMAEAYRDGVIGYISVIKDGRYKLQDYLNAVKYVCYKLGGSSNIDAYAKTFPVRYGRMVAKGTPQKDVASMISVYGKNKLVSVVFEQTLIPVHIYNADLHQKAINVQAELMMHASSEKVRSDAASSLMLHLKPPETTKIELDIGIKEDSIIGDLRASTLALVAQQKKMLELGVIGTEEVAHSNLIIEHNEVEDGY